VLPATAKNWPGGPVRVTSTGEPAVTTVCDTDICTPCAHAGIAVVSAAALMTSAAAQLRRPTETLDIHVSPERSSACGNAGQT
jgi:hypothetical protein